MIADHSIKKAFKEKDENGRTLFAPRAFSKKKVALNSKEEKELKSFLRKICNFFAYTIILSIPILQFYAVIFIPLFIIIYKIGIKRILKNKA